MAKAIKKIIKLQVMGGAANPAPPLGPALGSEGVNIQQFCAQFNEASKDKRGQVLPVVITVYQDRSFSFIIKAPLAAELIKKAIGVDKGSGTPNRAKVGKITLAKLQELAEQKLADLNTDSPQAGAKILAGTARSMGVEVIE